MLEAWMQNRKARWIRPAGDKAKPWIGQVVNPKYSALGAILDYENTSHYAIVRCIDPCDARGLMAGDDYLVRVSFIASYPPVDGEEVPLEVDVAAQEVTDSQEGQSSGSNAGTDCGIVSHRSPIDSSGEETQ
jgi:hypothetical protein